MDPLTITTGVLSLSGVCVTNARRLYDLKSRFDLSSITLTAILSETAVVSASLGQIQTALLQCSSSFVNQLVQNPVLLGALDTALIGCSMVFLALQEEIDKLELEYLKAGADPAKVSQNIGFKQKLQLLWNENTMKELLTQIRGQQTSMTLLLQALNITSMTDLHALMKDNSAHLERLAESTARLRKSYPSIRAPTSIFDTARDDGVSIFSHSASTAGATEFEFDNFVMESRVYRRAFMGGYLRPRRVSNGTASIAESDTDTIRLADEDGSVDDDANTIRDTQEEAVPNSNPGPITEGEEAPILTATGLDTSNLPKKSLYQPPVAKNKSRRILTVKAPHGGTLEMDADCITQVLKDMEEFQEKYRKVKKYYFEKDFQLQKEQFENKRQTNYLLNCLDYSRSIIDNLDATTCHGTNPAQDNAQAFVVAEIDSSTIMELEGCLYHPDTGNVSSLEAALEQKPIVETASIALESSTESLQPGEGASPPRPGSPSSTGSSESSMMWDDFSTKGSGSSISDGSLLAATQKPSRPVSSGSGEGVDPTKEPNLTILPSTWNEIAQVPLLYNLYQRRTVPDRPLYRTEALPGVEIDSERISEPINSSKRAMRGDWAEKQYPYVYTNSAK